MKFPFGEARGKEEIYNPVIEALSEKPMTLRDLCAQPLLSGEIHANIIEAVVMLAASSRLSRVGTRMSDTKTADEMNRVILERASYSSEIEFMVSPLLRTGVPVPWLKQLLLKAVRQNLKADDYIWSILESIGHRLKVEGKTLSDPEENKAEIRSKLDEFLKIDLPHLTRLGI